MSDPFEVAELLVRCSGVPLPRIATVLGFAELEPFSQWFEDRSGQHPETVRAEWETLTAAPPQYDAPDGPDEELLVRTRRLLFSLLERQEMAPMIRALRSRRPITPDRQ